MHYEGRHYTSLIRHLILALIVLGFVAEHTERLRGGKSGGDGRASVPGVEYQMCNGVPPPPRHSQTDEYQRDHSVSPKAKQASEDFAQETAA